MSDYWTFPESRPDYDREAPDPGRVRPGGGISHRCLDCDWRGNGVGAYDHHKQDHHRIVIVALAHLGPVAFFCCGTSPYESEMTEQDVDALASRMAR